MGNRPLAGRVVVTTRDVPGRLDSILAGHGADVVHVPLIEIGEPDDGGTGLRRALAGLADVDWVVVTSRHGAERVAEAVAAHPHLRLAAVGTATARTLTERCARPVDVVPDRQTGADLVAAMGSGPGRVLVAQADRADRVVADGLRSCGFAVEAVDAYATRLRHPSAAERAVVGGADAVAFASGSAIEAWVAAFGPVAPPVVAAIGPSTAAAGERIGLQSTHVAADHDLDGLAAVVVSALAP